MYPDLESYKANDVVFSPNKNVVNGRTANLRMTIEGLPALPSLSLYLHVIVLMPSLLPNVQSTRNTTDTGAQARRCGKKKFISKYYIN